MTATIESTGSVLRVKPVVDDLAPRFTRLSDEVWGCPELRWEEHRSLEKQIAAAEEFGGRITREAGGVPTAYMAEWGSGSPVIGFLGEYDALYGLNQKAFSVVPEPDPDNPTANGHGCGHNMLGAGSTADRDTSDAPLWLAVACTLAVPASSLGKRCSSAGP